MTITFTNDSNVIVYALEMIVSFPRENQCHFVANCAWWIAGVIGLDSGLTRYIDSLETRKRITQPSVSLMPRDSCKAIIEGEKDSESLQQHSRKIHPDRLQQISTKRMVSPTPRDLTKDKEVNQIVDGAKQFIEESV